MSRVAQPPPLALDDLCIMIWMSLDRVLNREGITRQEWQALYQSVYTFCTHQASATAQDTQQRGTSTFRGGDLYYRLDAELQERMRVYAQETRGLQGVNLLQRYADLWSIFFDFSMFIDHTFSYINRYWRKRENEKERADHDCVVVVFHLSIRKWREYFFMAVKDNLIAALLAEIERERHGEAINQELVKSVCLSLAQLSFNPTPKVDDDYSEIVLDTYVEHFEGPFLVSTATFYTLEATRFLESNTVADFMRKVEARLAEEDGRVQRYLHVSSKPHLLRTCEDVLIRKHIGKIQDEFVAMLAADKFDDMRRLYKLLARIVGGLAPLLERFREYIKDEGTLRLANLHKTGAAADEGDGDGEGGDDEGKGKAAAAPAAAAAAAKGKDAGKVTFKEVVEELIAIHDRYWFVVAEVFGGDASFKLELERALSHCMNPQGNRSPEYLSLYLDDTLKKGAKADGEASRDDVVDKCLVLFRRLEEKDLFERYYKTHLAKRLLQGRSASSDAERDVIAKLKRECGTAFTHKLEGMFKDIQLSDDLMTGFLASSFGAGLPLSLSVKVLTTGIWPLVSAECALPAEAIKCQTKFAAFYGGLHSGRVLAWENTQGSAELRAAFGAKTHEISVSTTQMAVLCLFNHQASMTLAQIHETLQIDAGTLERDLLALSCAKYKVLSKEPKTKRIVAGDVFTVNAEFTCKLFKFKIGTVVAPESNVDRDKTNKKNDEDRAFKIDAAVVRVMKARKTLDHANLIAEVTRQLQSRFVPNPQMIKRQIEKLIEREYLERSTKDRKIYNYLA